MLENRMVYQISPGDGDSKSAKASTHAKFEPWEKFTQNKKQRIRLVGSLWSRNHLWVSQVSVSFLVYVIRYRSPQEILESAQQLCDESYGKCQYNLWNNNCQHFASKCCTGFEWSHEARNSIESFHVDL